MKKTLIILSTLCLFPVFAKAQEIQKKDPPPPRPMHPLFKIPPQPIPPSHPLFKEKVMVVKVLKQATPSKPPIPPKKIN